MPQKCVGGRGSAPDTAAGAYRTPPKRGMGRKEEQKEGERKEGSVM